MKRPRYFVQLFDSCMPAMLYAVWAADKIAYANGGNRQASDGWGNSIIAYMQSRDDFHPCNLADVRASFDNIKAPKYNELFPDNAGTQTAIQ